MRAQASFTAGPPQAPPRPHSAPVARSSCRHAASRRPFPTALLGRGSTRGVGGEFPTVAGPQAPAGAPPRPDAVRPGWWSGRPGGRAGSPPARRAPRRRRVGVCARDDVGGRARAVPGARLTRPRPACRTGRRRTRPDLLRWAAVNALALGPEWLQPDSILQWLGPWALVGLALIVFAECGLLIGFFLPGDSLLFTAGLFVADGAIRSPLLAGVRAVGARRGARQRVRLLDRAQRGPGRVRAAAVTDVPPRTRDPGSSSTGTATGPSCSAASFRSSAPSSP